MRGGVVLAPSSGGTTHWSLPSPNPQHPTMAVCPTQATWQSFPEGLLSSVSALGPLPGCATCHYESFCKREMVTVPASLGYSKIH